MNRSSISPQAKSKPKAQTKGPSAGLTEFLAAKFNGKVPLAALTAATKLYGKHRPLKREDRTLKRLSANGSDVAAAALTEFLATETHEKGKAPSEEAVKRIFAAFANEGRLSFEYLLKLGESSGVALTANVAKAIVRKYGKRKDHLTEGDCLATVARRNNSANRSTSKSPKK